MKKLMSILIGAVMMTGALFAQGNGNGNGEIRKSSRAIKDHYIVVLDEEAFRDRQDLPSVASDMARSAGGRLGHLYEHALKGFSIEMTEGRARALARDPRVLYVEEDAEVFLEATQSNATWGLDRIDQRDRPLNGSYVYNQTGSGVRAYIIDTGIRASHNEFGGRVISGYSSINDGNGSNDCNGHGTHVAGTVGGALYGVAKAVTLVPVRVLNCQGSGTNAGVIAGVDWVTSNRVRPAVANMSLGGGASSALDTAVKNSIAAGVTYVVAAGNDNRDACNYSPARVAEAITVGSTTSSDARSSFSNFGSCVNIFAPGSSITAAWHTSNTATNTISGTSMAAPHVAGVAALYLQTSTTASPSTVAAAIRDNASLNKLSSIGTGSPNRLLYSLFGSSTPPPPAPSQLLKNPGFESGNNGDWTASSGVITNSTARPARSGSWKAWMCGYGRTYTDTAFQTVTIPSSATKATLSFWLRVDSAETTTSIAYDTLRVQLRNTSNGVLTTLATYSNLHKGSSYVQRSFDITSYRGQTLRVYFLAQEDSTLQTSFVIDDTALIVE
jgi:subtilisin family serine protease